MRRTTILSAAILFLIVVLIGQSACTTDRSNDSASGAVGQTIPNDEAAVRATLDALESAWNRHDIGGFRELLTEKVQWIVSNGNCWRSRQAVGDAYEILHDSILTSTEPNPLARLSIDSIEVQFLAPRLAIGMATLRFGGTVPVSAGGPVGPTTRASFVMSHEGGTWRVAQFQQTTLDPRIEREDPLWGDPDRQ